MAFDFYLADTLQRWGFMDFILPFVLIFTIVFAVLQKVKLFGSKDQETRKFNVIIAVVMGLAVVVPHGLGMYPRDRDPVTIMLTAIPNVSIVLVAVLMALLIIGLLGKRFELGGSGSGWFILVAFAIIGFIFGNAAGWWQSPAWLSFVNNQDIVALIVTILVFAIIINFITSEKKKEDDSFLGKLDGMLKGEKD